MNYSIKEVSEKTHLSPYTLRYYEKEGLLPFVKRNENGIRRFSDEDLDWLGLICCLKSTGMPIKQIKEFINLSTQGCATLKQRCNMLNEHKWAIEEQLREMQLHLDKVNMKIQCFTKQYQSYITGLQQTKQA